jgi:gamma-glutamylputrescine oxidase
MKKRSAWSRSARCSSESSKLKASSALSLPHCKLAGAAEEIGREGVLDYVDSHYRRTARPAAQRPALTEATEAEVCVVGGGLAGLTTALLLAEKKRTVVLLEARRIGWGASGRNGGFVSAGGFARKLPDLVALLGRDEAIALHELSRDGWALVRDLIAAHGIDCGQVWGTLLPSCFDDPDGPKRFAADMAEMTGRTYRYLPRDELAEMVSSPRYYDGLFDAEGFHIHPLNYCLAIADLAERAGARLHEECPATSLAPDGAGWRVGTAHGTVTAQHVVLAAGGYQDGLHAPTARAVLPIATYILLTEPIGENLLKSAIRVPYGIADDRFAVDYYRALPENRILWGGRVSARQGRPAFLAATMRRDMAKVYPQLAGVKGEVAWMGTMSYARHRMPQIGGSAPGLWHAIGFGGRGLNTTAMAGQLLAAAIADGDDRYRRFAAFGTPWAGGPFGLLAAQATYWSYQARDAWRRFRLNRGQPRSARTT